MMSFQFDARDATKIRLDTAALDRWIDQWPDAKVYLVFLSVAHYSGAIRSSLGGAAIDSPEFQQRVGTWISVWVKHLRSRGIAPNRLGDGRQTHGSRPRERAGLRVSQADRRCYTPLIGSPTTSLTPWK